MTNTNRRGFLGRCVAATVGLFAGGGIAASAAAPIRDRQTIGNLRVFRLTTRNGVPTYGKIDWFDQKIGDRIVGVWVDPVTGTFRSAGDWTPIGEPHRTEHGTEAVRVDNASCRDLTYADIAWTGIPPHTKGAQS